MTFDEFVQKYDGKPIDFDGSYGNQCFDLYRQYCKDVLNVPQSPPTGTQGAAVIWDNYLKEFFDAIENTSTGYPAKGDIVIWKKATSLPYGHVAVAISGDTKKFVSFDQNWPTGSLCHTQDHTYTNVKGWLRYKKQPIVTTDVPQALQVYGKGSLADLVAYIDLLREDSKNLVIQSQLANERKDFIEKLATQLNCSSEYSVITTEIGKLLTIEEHSEDAQKKLTATIKEKDAEIAQYKEDLQKLRIELDQLKADHIKQIETVSNKVDLAVGKTEQAVAQKEQLNIIQQLLVFFTKLKGNK